VQFSLDPMAIGFLRSSSPMVHGGAPRRVTFLPFPVHYLARFLGRAVGAGPSFPSEQGPLPRFARTPIYTLGQLSGFVPVRLRRLLFRCVRFCSAALPLR